LQRPALPAMQLPAEVLLICVDDLQYCDLWAFKVMRSLLKKFDWIAIVGAYRDNYIEKPSFVNPNSKWPTQETVCKEGIEKI
jgi:hypothetical protein